MHLCPKQAIDLENKLNLSKYGLEWSSLGDILYQWRIHPDYNSIKCNTTFKVTEEQYKWIQDNIMSVTTDDKCFELIL